MAVEDINAAGGVNGQKLELVIGDDACDPKQATAVANKMVSGQGRLRGRALLLGLVDPGVGHLQGRQDPADHAGFDQHQADR